jgi:hypothetical protein
MAGGDADRDATALDQVDTVSGVGLVEDNLVTRERAPARERERLGDDVIGDAVEQPPSHRRDQLTTDSLAQPRPGA